MSTRQNTLFKKHRLFERNTFILLLGILVVVAIGGLIEIVPLFYLKNTIEKDTNADKEEALRASEVRFSRFFNDTPFAIATLDKAGRILRTNAPFSRRELAT